MQNPAPTDVPVHALIRDRWSPRAFADRPVDEATLATLFEAARWSPSSFNEQPWTFVVATKAEPEEWARILDCLAPSNQAWAKAAPVLMVSVAKLAFDRTGKENRHALHDVGMATENLFLQATALGAVAHAMAGFSLEKARESLRIPATHVPVAGIALGWPGDPSTLTPELRARETAPRVRRPVADLVRRGAFA